MRGILSPRQRSRLRQSVARGPEGPFRITPLGQTFLHHVNDLLRTSLGQPIEPASLFRCQSGSGDGYRFAHLPHPHTTLACMPSKTNPLIATTAFDDTM